MYIHAVVYVTVQLHLLQHDDEVYEFSLPSAYARSILTVPWVELGDKISVSCAKTGYSANVVFHTKVSLCCSELVHSVHCVSCHVSFFCCTSTCIQF